MSCVATTIWGVSGLPLFVHNMSEARVLSYSELADFLVIDISLAMQITCIVAIETVLYRHQQDDLTSHAHPKSQNLLLPALINLMPVVKMQIYVVC